MAAAHGPPRMGNLEITLSPLEGMPMNRRNLLAALPAVAATIGLQNGVAAADPIFTALEEYHRADRAYGDVGELLAEDPVFIAALDAYDAATMNLEATKPVTMAGCIALLEFAVDDLNLDGGLTLAGWHAPVMRGVLDALTRLAG